MAKFLNLHLVKVERAYVLKLFSVLFITPSYLSGRVSIVDTEYGSIVVDILIATTTCLLKVTFRSQFQMYAA